MSQNQATNLQDIREKYIKALYDSKNATEEAKILADDLFALDLTVYSKEYSFDSIIYNSLAKSILDDSISMHPEQMAILQEIEKNDALIVSAPTSFGKTFCIFEYIAKHQPNNIVLVVPTLALVDEYRNKIIKKYKDKFSKYKIYTNLDDDKQYNFENKNIFILTHDRVVQENIYSLIKKIDFLVIDEVYKLEKDLKNDRVLVLNMAYYYMAKIAEKYVLLAPFIKEVEDTDKLDKKPVLYSSNYSPVVNEVKTIPILDEKDRELECKRKLAEISSSDKTLIYFPTVTEIYKYIKNVVKDEPVIDDIPENIKYFIEWAKDEIHEDWGLIKALERGYLIHNGQMPIGTRLFQMDSYENSKIYNKMFCTATLLEGVNTTAKNIIITKPARGTSKHSIENPFSAFDFYNLVGRTGRLYKHHLGIAYYIKAPGDIEYKKIDAVKSIKFELTDNSKDVDIQIGNIEKHPDVIEFLNQLQISNEEYLLNNKSKIRFENVQKIYNKYKELESELLEQLRLLHENDTLGRGKLIKILYSIVNQKENALESTIINKLINRQRFKIRTIIKQIAKHSEADIDYIISTVIRLKMGYIEHQFYSRVLLIRFFMEKHGVEQELINILNDKVINAIEQLYFVDSTQKKMLVDMGIYERDVEKIIEVIGNEYEDINELKNKLIYNIEKLENISFISKYIIKNLI